jgi:cbb3-type cytochrome oxidase maturation protein
MWSMLLLIILTLCAGFVGWLFFLWAVKSGQYDDIEGPKYRMLDDEEDAKRDDREHKDKKP